MKIVDIQVGSCLAGFTPTHTKTFSLALHEIRTEMMARGLYYVLPEEVDVCPTYSHINNMYCGVFSDKVLELFQEAIALTNEDIGLSDCPHYFIKYQNRYYDADCINGVSNPRDLPLFKGVKMSFWGRLKRIFRRESTQS